MKDKNINLRLSQDERELINDLAKHLGLTQHDILVNSVLLACKESARVSDELKQRIGKPREL